MNLIIVLNPSCKSHNHDYLSLQLEIVAYDTAYENDKATATVTVSVNRNPSQPRFLGPEGLNYLRMIDENTPIGTTVLDLNATDDDGV